MGGVLLGLYRPPLPNGYPGVDFQVGRTSTNFLKIAVDGATGTSTTSLNPSGKVGTDVSFDTQSGVTYWSVGQELYIPSASNGNVSFFGIVKSYSSTTLVVTISAIGTTTGVKADWNIFNLPNLWSSAAGLIRINSSAADWDFTLLPGHCQVQVPNVVLSQSLFSLANTVINNNAFFATTGGSYYSVTNCDFAGLSSTANVTALVSASCILFDRCKVTRWPQDWADPGPLLARVNSTAVALGYGCAVATNIGLDFICTTAGTTAGSEPAGYATAVNGGTVTDGTAVFTAQDTKHIFSNNYIDVASSGPLHPDGMQIQTTAWNRGANLLVTNNIIDLSNPVPGGINSRVINFAGNGSNIATDMAVNYNVLLNTAQTYVMSWGGTGATITGSAEYTNNYYNTAPTGLFYDGDVVGANFTMNGCRNYQTGAQMTFSVKDGTGTHTGLLSYP